MLLYVVQNECIISSYVLKTKFLIKLNWFKLLTKYQNIKASTVNFYSV